MSSKYLIGYDQPNDEDDLIPYDILNRIDFLAFRDKRSPQGWWISLF